MSRWLGEAIIFDKLFKQLGKWRIRKGIISAFRYLKGCHGEMSILILGYKAGSKEGKFWLKVERTFYPLVLSNNSNSCLLRVVPISGGVQAETECLSEL